MRKVLLVDDEPLVLVGLRGMADWNALGWEIAGTARNGGEALALIREKKPELVLCDIRMPVMTALSWYGSAGRRTLSCPCSSCSPAMRSSTMSARA